MHVTELNVGPATYMRGGRIAIGRYSNGEIALLIVGEDGEEQAVATVALAGVGPVGPAKLWLKGWNENDGVPEALQAAGLVRLTPVRHPTGFAAAVLAEVLPPLAEAIANS